MYVLHISSYQLLCIIVEEESDIAAFKDYQPPTEDTPPPSTPAPESQAAPPPPAPPPTQPTPPPPPSPPPTQPMPSGERVIASPFAKNIAAQQGVNLQVLYLIY